MDRAALMAVRLSVPAIVALAAALVLFAIGVTLERQPLLSPLANDGFIASNLALAACAILSAVSAFRFWRWSQGKALECPHCAGLLGREREGRFGPYRKCFACSKNVARLNYA